MGDNEEKVYYLDDILPFGKHRGRSINSIWSTDPGYIRWATGNGVFKVVGENRPAKEEEKPYWHDCPEFEPRECPF
jgi:hypothetical protein